MEDFWDCPDCGAYSNTHEEWHYNMCLWYEEETNEEK